MNRKLAWILLASLAALTMSVSTAAPPTHATLEPHLGYGINVRNAAHLDSLAAPLGFEWVKLWEEYGPLPVAPLPYDVLFMITCDSYIGDLQAWGDHVQAVAEAGRGIVDAYEICNEPNVTTFWGNQPPDPARYTAMLCTAYERIQATDPAAIVVSAGLAPVGRISGTCNGWPGNDCGAMDERRYAEAMLAEGAGSCMDAFGYHPYGFAYAPEQDAESVPNGFAFRGAEVMHQILVDNGLVDLPLWATEFNWLRNPSADGALADWCHRIPAFEDNFGWMLVSEAQQADYLRRAYQYADENWPWMHGMFVWNLDWHNYNWLCEPSRYFSVRRNDGTDLGSPTQAYAALAAMPRRPASFAPRLRLQPDRLVLLADVDQPRLITTGALVRNGGYRTFDWTAEADPNGQIVPTLLQASGTEGASLWLTVDTTAFPLGLYSGAITVTATTSDVLDSPAILPLEVHVVADLWTVHLPLALHSGR